MPYTGGLRRSLVPQNGAQVWGTGINPVHEVWGSPADRLEDWPMRRGEISPASESVPESIVNPEQWGYTLEDSRATDLYADDRPEWNEQPPEFRGDAGDQPAWDAAQSVNENFRAQHQGAHRLFRGRSLWANYREPSETVSEGWRNKKKGEPGEAKPSDPSQYEMQTSMAQRDRTRVNDQAVARSTDAPRASIASRIIGQKLKIYSGGLRHYDMFPRQQTASLPRPFYYRTAGTGRAEAMEPNETFVPYPIERTPPPDPSIGIQEDDLQAGYGYTPEDVGAYY